MKLGIALKDLGPSQLSYHLVHQANAMLAQHPTLDIVAFVEGQSPSPLSANFAQMPIYEAWGYGGDVIATNFTTAAKLLDFPCPKRRFFYVWDLEWVRPFHRRMYGEWEKVYRCPHLKLIARSAEHASVIERCWNRPVWAVLEDLNLERFIGWMKEGR